ncbi:MAG TPA: TIGR01777 family protein [Planctomycetes bacterium]|nr:TIGR01777 family protein [Planctomycetota bacterium]
MDILVTGASGLVGSSLVRALEAEGHRVTALRRVSGGASEIVPPGTAWWDPEGGTIDLGNTPIDAVVHLAGENIASGRWTRAKKRRIRDSRVEGTQLLARALAKRSSPPRVLVSASAVGFSGDLGEKAATETTEPGDGFLAEVCAEWEEATGAASDAGIRVVLLRIGVVFSAEGGALAKMLLAFRLGLGGRVGSGRQYVSWIHLRDLIAIIQFALEQDEIEGPLIAAAPGAVTNAELTRELGRVLHRPTLLPLPAFAARIALGEMADELLLASVRATPEKLLAHGFSFAFPSLAPALADLLG